MRKLSRAKQFFGPLFGFLGKLEGQEGPGAHLGAGVVLVGPLEGLPQGQQGQQRLREAAAARRRIPGAAGPGGPLTAIVTR